MFPFTLDIYCTSVRPGRGIPHMWLSLRFLLSFYLLKGFFSSFSLLLLRVKGRGCHTLLKPYETNCGLWIWAIQIKFDWLIDWSIWLMSQTPQKPQVHSASLLSTYWLITHLLEIYCTKVLFSYLTHLFWEPYGHKSQPKCMEMQWWLLNHSMNIIRFYF